VQSYTFVRIRQHWDDLGLDRFARNHSGSKLLNTVVFYPQQVIFSLVVKIVGFDFLVIIMQTKFYKDIELSLSSH